MQVLRCALEAILGLYMLTVSIAQAFMLLIALNADHKGAMFLLVLLQISVLACLGFVLCRDSWRVYLRMRQNQAA
jgi:hypothetical protein